MLDHLDYEELGTFFLECVYKLEFNSLMLLMATLDKHASHMNQKLYLWRRCYDNILQCGSRLKHKKLFNLIRTLHNVNCDLPVSSDDIQRFSFPKQIYRQKQNTATVRSLDLEIKSQVKIMLSGSGWNPKI